VGWVIDVNADGGKRERYRRPIMMAGDKRERERERIFGCCG
jgi:hypothetical protein